LKDSFASPTGGYVTPAIKDAIMRSGQRDLQQEAGAETRAGAYDANRLNMSNRLAMANLTKPILTQLGSQTAGQTTGSSKTSESPWATILQSGMAAAPISL